MLCYGGLRGDRSSRRIPPTASSPARWSSTCCEPSGPGTRRRSKRCRSLAEAIGARLALARTRRSSRQHEARSGPRHASALNVLANIARLLERRDDRDAASAEIVERSSALPWVRSVRLARPTSRRDRSQTRLADERIVARTIERRSTIVGVPLIYEGERSAAIDLMLDERLTDSTSSSAQRADLRRQRLRQRPAARPSARRDAGRRADRAAELPPINEQLVEAVHASKSSGRPVTRVAGRHRRPRRDQPDDGYASATTWSSYVGTRCGTVVVDARSRSDASAAGCSSRSSRGWTATRPPFRRRMMVERITKNAPQHLPAIALVDRRLGVPAAGRRPRRPGALRRGSRSTRRRAAARTASSWPSRRTSAGCSDARDAFVRIITEQQMPAGAARRRLPRIGALTHDSSVTDLVRPSPRSQRVLAARRRLPRRRALPPHRRRRRSRHRADRSRRHVRRGRVPRQREEARPHADHRLRGLHRAARPVRPHRPR